jgi:hypothetical protein
VCTSRENMLERLPMMDVHMIIKLKLQRYNENEWLIYFFFNSCLIVT